mmetsp:Transcript_20497/g.50937  ORF Transcript_20497/g.50937 Transcript_20497/m.50937 type:complete len:320 (+) Transcript_20497:1440-2399(+)
MARCIPTAIENLSANMLSIMRQSIAPHLAASSAESNATIKHPSSSWHSYPFVIARDIRTIGPASRCASSLSACMTGRDTGDIILLACEWLLQLVSYREVCSISSGTITGVVRKSGTLNDTRTLGADVRGDVPVPDRLATESPSIALKYEIPRRTLPSLGDPGSSTSPSIPGYPKNTSDILLGMSVVIVLVVMSSTNTNEAKATTIGLASGLLWQYTASVLRVVALLYALSSVRPRSQFSQDRDDEDVSNPADNATLGVTPGALRYPGAISNFASSSFIRSRRLSSSAGTSAKMLHFALIFSLMTWMPRWHKEDPFNRLI